jgi:hypothetical protein
MAALKKLMATPVWAASPFRAVGPRLYRCSPVAVLAYEGGLDVHILKWGLENSRATQVYDFDSLSVIDKEVWWPWLVFQLGARGSS